MPKTESEFIELFYVVVLFGFHVLHIRVTLTVTVRVWVDLRLRGKQELTCRVKLPKGGTIFLEKTWV